MNQLASLIIFLAIASCSICRELQNSLLDITFPLQQEVVAEDSSINHLETNVEETIVPVVIPEEELFIEIELYPVHESPNEWAPEAIVVEESLFVNEPSNTVLGFFI